MQLCTIRPSCSSSSYMSASGGSRGTLGAHRAPHGAASPRRRDPVSRRAGAGGAAPVYTTPRPLKHTHRLLTPAPDPRTPLTPAPFKSQPPQHHDRPPHPPSQCSPSTPPPPQNQTARASPPPTPPSPPPPRSPHHRGSPRRGRPRASRARARSGGPRARRRARRSRARGRARPRGG